MPDKKAESPFTKTSRTIFFSDAPRSTYPKNALVGLLCTILPINTPGSSIDKKKTRKY